MNAPVSRDQVLDRYTRHVNKSLASLARLTGAFISGRLLGPGLGLTHPSPK